jgi:hypothetical protein
MITCLNEDCTHTELLGWTGLTFKSHYGGLLQRKQKAEGPLNTDIENQRFT